MAHLLEDVDSHKQKRVRHNLVIRRRPDLPKVRNEPWFLMIDLGHEAERTGQLYGRRISMDNPIPPRESISPPWSLSPNDLLAQ